MTPTIVQAFERIKREHGASSIARVELMMNPRKQDRHPLQEGAKWVMPGLSRRPWHDPYEHHELAPIVRQLEAQHPAIKDEYLQLCSRRAGSLENYQHYLMTHDDWKAFYIYRGGRLTAESAQLTPVTHRVLADEGVGTGLLCPLLESHFSTLKAGAAIPPHCDLWNFSINLHLAVDIPNDCAIRVAGEVREWEEGKCLLFDYSFLHDAWNRSARPRTCLLVDLWHPEVTRPEREALVALITEIRGLTDGAAASAPAPPRKSWAPWRLLAPFRRS